MPSYLVLYCARSVALFLQKDRLRIAAGEFGQLQIEFRTHYEKKEQGVEIPGDMWIEVRGDAPSLDIAIEAFGNAVSAILPIIALATNAFIDGTNVVLAFDITPGLSQREFLQSYIESERSLFEVRYVNKAATVSVINTINSHLRADRLHRAINQYLVVMSHWKPGREILSLAHLYMGMEALTPLAVDYLCHNQGVTDDELKNLWNIQKDSDFRARVRKEVLFFNDSECYKLAREASDGFEHGYLSINKIHSNAIKVRNKIKEYLRTSILTLMNLDKTSLDFLLSPSFIQPIGFWPIERRLRVNLISSGKELSQAGYEYPWFEKRTTIDRTIVDENTGEYKVTFNEELIPHLGKGVLFQEVTLETWGQPSDRSNQSKITKSPGTSN